MFFVDRHCQGSFHPPFHKMADQSIDFIQCGSSIALRGAGDSAHASSDFDRVLHLLFFAPVVPHQSRNGEDRREMTGVVADGLWFGRQRQPNFNDVFRFDRRTRHVGDVVVLDRL